MPSADWAYWLSRGFPGLQGAPPPSLSGLGPNYYGQEIKGQEREYFTCSIAGGASTVPCRKEHHDTATVPLVIGGLLSGGLEAFAALTPRPDFVLINVSGGCDILESFNDGCSIDPPGGCGPTTDPTFDQGFAYAGPGDLGGFVYYRDTPLLKSAYVYRNSIVWTDQPANGASDLLLLPDDVDAVYQEVEVDASRYRYGFEATVEPLWRSSVTAPGPGEIATGPIKRGVYFGSPTHA